MQYLSNFLLTIVAISMLMLLSCQPTQESHAETNTTTTKTYVVKKTPIKPYGDAIGDDAIWAHAEVLSDFQFPWQERSAPPTTFKALWDEEGFYFQFTVEDDDVVIIEDSLKEMAAVQSDRVELFFSVNDSLKPYYTIEMDPQLRAFDAKANYYRQVDNSWNWPGLTYDATIYEGGYLVEGMIPLPSFAELDLWQKGGQKELRCGIFRAEFEYQDDSTVAQNWISWIQPEVSTPDFHIPAAFGTLIFEE